MWRIICQFKDHRSTNELLFVEDPNMASHTVYIRNLNEKVSLKKLEFSLREIFNENGFPVKNIQTCHNIQLRGQAFVVFDDSVELDQVMDTLNTEYVLGKPLHIQRAKKESDLLLKGTDKFNEYITKEREERIKRRTGKDNSKKRSHEDDEDVDNDENKPNKKRMKEIVPNRILIITELSDEVTQSDLIELFEKYKGFLTANYVSVRHVGLIEFQNESEAVECYKSVGEIPLVKGKKCSLTFAKK